MSQDIFPGGRDHGGAHQLLANPAALATRGSAEHPASVLLLLLGAQLVCQASRVLEQPRLGPQPLAA